MTFAIGNDVARWQIYFDPDKASGPVDFSIMKMTEGVTEYIYPEILTGWQKTGIRGGYHYQRSGVSWQAQADKFMQVANRYDTHFLAVDLEDAGNTVNTVMYQDTQKTIDYLQTKQSRPVLLYTNKNHYQLMQAIVGKAWMDGVLFWYANPTGTPGVMPLPTGRTTWTIHQYSWTGAASRWGTGGATDENIFNGTLEQMRAWLGVEVPPTNGGTMITGTIKAGVVLNVRAVPTTGAVITTLNAGDKVYGDIDPVSGWFKIQYLIRLSGTRQDFSPATYCSASATYYTGSFVTVTPSHPAVETVDVQLPAGAVVIFKDATGKEIARYTA